MVSLEFVVHIANDLHNLSCTCIDVELWPAFLAMASRDSADMDHREIAPGHDKTVQTAYHGWPDRLRMKNSPYKA